MKRIGKWGLALVAIAGLGVLALVIDVGDVTGRRAEGRRAARMAQSPQFNPAEARFTNALPRIDASFVAIVYEYFLGGSTHRLPQNFTFPVIDPRPTWAQSSRSGLRVTWLGHSTFLVEIDGIRTLVDPIWSERASPFTWAGPRRFFKPIVPIEDVPPIQAVLISHDHYDHLDRFTVGQLAQRSVQWIVPIGLGAHLEYWGVGADKITELDWWESTKVGAVTITSTPSRHFSGRSIFFTDQNATLWT
ncbi:MAG: MBL fold metallo-hydrolase, partial [Myxococcota bacterium]|nr:MBL fold metallo-hydrolase [Myxococcota bacterium]